MKFGAVEFALFLLVDVALGLPAQHPDALLSGRPGGSRRTEKRQQLASSLPLYMMQLYRILLTEDRDRTPSGSVGPVRKEDNPGLHDADSVISLVAKSK